MTSQASIDAGRVAFLRLLHESTGGNSMTGRVRFADLGRQLGLTDVESSEIAMYLKERGLGTFPTMGGSYAITPAGVNQVETWNRERESQTPPTPATASTLVLTVAECRDVEAALALLEREDVASKLAGDDLAEFESERTTATAQLRSPRPKRTILKAALSRLADFAVQVGSTTLGSVLSKLLG